MDAFNEAVEDGALRDWTRVGRDRRITGGLRTRIVRKTFWPKKLTGSTSIYELRGFSITDYELPFDRELMEQDLKEAALAETRVVSNNLRTMPSGYVCPRPEEFNTLAWLDALATIHQEWLNKHRVVDFSHAAEVSEPPTGHQAGQPL